MVPGADTVGAHLGQCIQVAVVTALPLLSCCDIPARQLIHSRKCLLLKFNLPSSSEMQKLRPLLQMVRGSWVQVLRAFVEALFARRHLS